MEHKQAIKIQACERYLLGDLTAAERNSFEEHFFECPMCAEDIRLGTLFADNAKAVFDDPDLRRASDTAVRDRSRWGWLRWPQLVPVGAALAFAAIAGVEAVELASFRQPQATYAAVIPPASKGDRPSVRAASSDRFVELSFVVDAVNSAGPYRCQLMSEAGKQVVNLVATAPPTGAPITLRLPQSSLEPGQYIMILHVASPNGGEREIERYPFTLEKN